MLGPEHQHGCLSWCLDTEPLPTAAGLGQSRREKQGRPHSFIHSFMQPVLICPLLCCKPGPGTGHPELVNCIGSCVPGASVCVEENAASSQREGGQDGEPSAVGAPACLGGSEERSALGDATLAKPGGEGLFFSSGFTPAYLPGVEKWPLSGFL